MPARAERYHWLNTIVGILDQAFHLSDEEQIHVLDIVNRLLAKLDIPDRSDPLVIPAPLALEISSGIYSTLLSGPRESGFAHPPRLTNHADIVVSVQAWSESLLSMLITAYPSISPVDRMVTAKIFSDLLDAIGVPDRAATFFPDDVVRVAREVDA
jgi:hypothetical protein